MIGQHLYPGLQKKACALWMRWHRKLGSCVRSTAAYIYADKVKDDRLLEQWDHIMSDCLEDWSGVVGRQPFLAERPGEHEGVDEDEDLDHGVGVEIETL